jgi:hypothetical protein
MSKTNIRTIHKLTLTSDVLSKVPAHDLRTLARGNRALAKAHKTGDAQAFAAAASAFSELGIHFLVWA